MNNSQERGGSVQRTEANDGQPSRRDFLAKKLKAGAALATLAAAAPSYGQDGGGGLGAMGGNSLCQIETSSPVIALIKENLEKTKKRMDTEGIPLSSPASSANTGGMF